MDENEEFNHEDYELSKLGKFGNKLKFIDKTPLKYFGSGYWVEKYGLVAKNLIEEYEQKADKFVEEKNISELEELSQEYRGKVKKTTYNCYKNWIIRFFPLMPTTVISLANGGNSLFHFINNQIQTPYVGELLGGLSFGGIVLAGAFILHDFACPSSIRKYLHYRQEGDERMARILMWAGFNPSGEFERTSKKYLENLIK